MAIVAKQFNVKQSTELRIISSDNTIFVKAKDLIQACGYNKNSKSALKLVDNDYKITFDDIKTKVGIQKYIPLKNQQGNELYFSETGIYQFVCSSKKEETKQVRDWVFKEVLPSIRKTGKYEKKEEKKQLMLMEEKKKHRSFVYRIINDVDDEVYIGSTTQKIGQRFRDHKKDSHRGSTMKLHQKMRDIGIKHFKIEMLDMVDYDDIEELRKMEQQCITVYRPSLNTNRAHSSEEERKKYESNRKKKWQKKNEYKYRCDACSYHTSNKEHYNYHCNSQKHKDAQWIWDNI
jgi:prophage antirepressor-like protein